MIDLKFTNKAAKHAINFNWITEVPTKPHKESYNVNLPVSATHS
jgi:hypothetical protein